MAHCAVGNYSGDRQDHWNGEAESFLEGEELLGDGGHDESGVLQAVIWREGKHHEYRLGLSDFGELVADCDKSEDERKWEDSFQCMERRVLRLLKNVYEAVDHGQKHRDGTKINDQMD